MTTSHQGPQDAPGSTRDEEGYHHTIRMLQADLDASRRLLGEAGEVEPDTDPLTGIPYGELS